MRKVARADIAVLESTRSCCHVQEKTIRTRTPVRQQRTASDVHIPASILIATPSELLALPSCQALERLARHLIEMHLKCIPRPPTLRMCNQRCSCALQARLCLSGSSPAFRYRHPTSSEPREQRLQLPLSISLHGSRSFRVEFTNQLPAV